MNTWLNILLWIILGSLGTSLAVLAMLVVREGKRESAIKERIESACEEI